MEMDDEKRAIEETNERIIQAYKQDEATMVLVFAQWCINNEFDPVELYQKAYPEQSKNDILLEALDKTVEKEEADSIDIALLFQVLDLFGNHDLAFVINQELEKISK